MSEKTLHAYLRRNIKAGVIDFSIRAEMQPGDTVKFYIHPESVSGDTEDYLLWDDPETGFDLLMPESAVPVPSDERFREFIKAYKKEGAL